MRIEALPRPRWRRRPRRFGLPPGSPPALRGEDPADPEVEPRSLCSVPGEAGAALRARVRGRRRRCPRSRSAGGFGAARGLGVRSSRSEPASDQVLFVPSGCLWHLSRCQEGALTLARPAARPALVTGPGLRRRFGAPCGELAPREARPALGCRVSRVSGAYGASSELGAFHCRIVPNKYF